MSVPRQKSLVWTENKLGCGELTEIVLLQHETGKEKRKLKLHPGRTVKSGELEVRLFEFLQEERSEGRVVRNKDLQRKAREIGAGLNLQDFDASTMWLQRWKKRHHVSSRLCTSSNQKVQADFEEQLLHFRRNILRLRHRHMYVLGQMLNMDQAIVRFDMPPNRTNEIKGSKRVGIKTTKAEKRGFTVALCAAADGSKLPAFLIFKERTGEIRQHLQIPANVHVTATRNGWMTRDQVLSWTQRVLGPSETRRLLLLANYAAHKAADVRAALDKQDVDLVFVPAGCTALAQPIDISIVKPFKVNETLS